MHALTTRRALIAAAAIAAIVVLAAVLHAIGENSPDRAPHGLTAVGASSGAAPGASSGAAPGSIFGAAPGSIPGAAPGASAANPDAAGSMPALLPAVRPSGAPVSVTVTAGPVGQPVPADFLGLSFELRSLPTLASYASRGNLVELLRSLGPGVLRFGGTSADEQVAWVAAGRSGRPAIGQSSSQSATGQSSGRPATGQSSRARDALPRWASTAITPGDLAALAGLVRRTGWRVLLSVNLGHYDPAAAAAEAAAARAALGSALAGIEIGNEPDRYVRKGLRAAGWDFAAYRAQAAAYRAAIAAAAPGVPIAGPDPSSGVPGLAWLGAAARALHPQLLTDHYYPLSSCGYRPTVEELLSPAVRRKDSALLARMLAIARAAATPLRVDELGSVSCEGFAGVSDTFASALWALDYTAHAAAGGAGGLNFHDLLAKPAAYSPLVAPSPAALASGALRAQPEWYALLAARELAGARPLAVRVAGAAPGELDASAFRAPDGRLRLVLVDYDAPSSRPLDVRLRIPPAASGRILRLRTPRAAAGSVLRLTGPSPAATDGVELGGRAVAPDGTWTPPAALPAVYERDGTMSVQLTPSSASVVTLYRH